MRPSYGPPGAPEGIPSDAVLEKEGAVIGQVIIDNQNIFNTEDPKDDKSLFRLANKLHIKTRANVVRQQLLFKPGDRYSRRLLDESERLLRAASYFYDAWIRPVRYHDGKVDLKVTTKDVWTLNPGFNYGRSGGTNSTGMKLEEGEPARHRHLAEVLLREQHRPLRFLGRARQHAMSWAAGPRWT